MKIAKVIEKVDGWQPNVFGVEDKLYWCYECTMNILNECPEYGTRKVKVTSEPMAVPLPVGAGLLDVEALYINGVRTALTDATDINDYSLRKGDEVVLVYRKYPARYEADGDEVPDELETVCGAPFESMYIDFVCAQIAFQQNDAAEYNKFIGAFNDKFTAYKNHYGSNAPASAPRQFENWF